jgi:thioesterase domain-containing protein/acyl carrier protein
VKIRGFRIELGEIESRLRQHEALMEASVVARDLGEGSLELVAYIVEDTPLSDDALREHIRRVLPDYMVPAHFVRLEALPLTPNGKVDRGALPAPAALGTSSTARAAPADEVERQLVAIWEEVLGHKGIGATDNFFASGGHSLKITRLAALVRERLKVEVPLTAFFKAATVREQARDLIAAARFGAAGVDGLMVPLNPGASGGKVFMFPPGTGDALGYLQLAELLRPHACYGFNFLDSERRLKVYADHIMGVDPDGPYVLFGYSAGGNLAYHTAIELEARGRRVAAVVMVDSGQVRLPLTFPEGEWERVADAFLGHESIRPYVATPVLLEKARRLIASYYAYMERSVDLNNVDADLYNLVCAASGEHVDAEGRLFVSRAGWAGVTRGRYAEIGADGDHHHMLAAPALAVNAARLQALCARIFSTMTVNP